MPENLYPQLSTVPSMSQESFNIETVRKYCQDIVNLKENYNEKQRKYENAYNRLLHASTGASTVGVISGISTIGTAFTIVGLPISASLGAVSTVSTCVGTCLLLTNTRKPPPLPILQLEEKEHITDVPSSKIEELNPALKGMQNRMG